MCLMDEHKTDIDADFDAELASYLSSCEGAGSYRVVKTLKSSDFEVTEKVCFCGRDGGELGLSCASASTPPVGWDMPTSG